MQEACAVGIEAAIMKKDPVITAYRCHGWAFTRGISIKAIMAEMMGNISSSNSQNNYHIMHT